MDSRAAGARFSSAVFGFRGIAFPILKAFSIRRKRIRGCTTVDRALGQHFISSRMNWQKLRETVRFSNRTSLSNNVFRPLSSCAAGVLYDFYCRFTAVGISHCILMWRSHQVFLNFPVQSTCSTSFSTSYPKCAPFFPGRTRRIEALPILGIFRSTCFFFLSRACNTRSVRVDCSRLAVTVLNGGRTIER